MKINEMKKVSKSAKLLFSQMSAAKQQIFYQHHYQKDISRRCQ